MNFKNLVGGLTLSLALTAGVATAHADTPAQIKERGTLRVAVDIGHPPYGMLDAQAQATGSDIETAKLLADDLGVKLEVVPVSGANRVPFLLANKADVVIASFSITAERKKVVNYSKPYGVIPVVIAAPKAVAITSTADLAGKNIAVARGTTADIELTRALKEAGASASIVRYEDEATTNTAVATGQQDVFSAALSTANSVAEQNANKGLEVKLTLAAYPMAIGLRKNDAELKTWVDEWVVANLANGKLNQIYVKYFNQNLPETIPE
ncbi:transporter substrate-binding domain-containing protein [Kaistia terrae]|jgi:polar amino acid transport system substrate-binding protein|uniref:Transporter substrate-binding domain-containing protein n=1 Tax=Kaistia terrae TaxID=537017 RepID=A0ABW0PVS9_9HYPH|nr:transporter substrate-binding domain-containing protein [Kaistia terrae]MCX5579295.1 transporter substrate-binding domain-containing protein [Kaistia terrae]